jgi:hypothetical protein
MDINICFWNDDTCFPTKHNTFYDSNNIDYISTMLVFFLDILKTVSLTLTN